VRLTREDLARGFGIEDTVRRRWAILFCPYRSWTLPAHIYVRWSRLANVLRHFASGGGLRCPAVMLSVSTQTTEVQVVASQVELAQEEIKEQEKQRVLGFIPNFYVSYAPRLRFFRG
jgi:hypothetical protein